MSKNLREAAYILNEYMNPLKNMQFDPPFSISDKRSLPRLVVELGSGTGTTAYGLSQLLDMDSGDVLVATDLEEVCPLLLDNLKPYTQPHGPVTIRPLRWGSQLHAERILTEFRDRGLTDIICSDLVIFQVHTRIPADS